MDNENIKFQQMQDEMSRFEAEISNERLLVVPPRPVIGSNTYSNMQQRLDAGPTLPGPPPLGLQMMFGNVPPPPPPPSLLLPPQVRARMTHTPLGPPVYGPGNYSIPPKPQPAVLSGAPQLYNTKKEKKKKDSAPKLAPPPEPVEVKEPEPVPTPVPASVVHDTSQSTSSVTPHKLSKKEKKNRKIIRTAGGQVWEDLSLMEWQDEDFRLFCGDLGNDVTDELLIRTFSKYSSFSKAKVVRDKRTNKSKGFGFISFKEPADFIKAMKEMNGRYVGSRPIKLRKSTWKARSLDVVRKKDKEKAALISLLTSGSSKP